MNPSNHHCQLYSACAVSEVIMENIDFIEARDDDHEEIVDFMNEHFIPHEPLNMSITLCEPGYRSALLLHHLQQSYQYNHTTIRHKISSQYLQNFHPCLLHLYQIFYPEISDK